MEKCKDTRIVEIDGRTMAVFVGEAGAEIAIPAAGLSAVFQQTNRLALAYDSQRGRKSEEWKFTHYLQPQTWNVGTVDTGAIALMVDQGLPTEQTLALSLAHAALLGPRLIEAVKTAKAPTKPQ